MSLVEYFIKEASAQFGSPILLYEFEMDVTRAGCESASSSSSSSSSSSDGNVFWRFCNQSYDFEWMGETWYRSGIKNTSVALSTELSKDGINLTFPDTDEFAQQFVGYAPDFIVFLTVFRGHLTQPDDEYAVFWRGRVGGGRLADREITLGCESIFTSKRRYALRPRYIRTCRHVLYKAGCGLCIDDFGFFGDITSSTSVNTLTGAFIGDHAAGFFIGGALRAPDGAMRHIIGHSGTTITLWYPIRSILTALEDNPVPVTLFPGCNKSVEDCRDKFNNILNFGGMPLLPSRNPFDGRSIV